MAWWPDELRDHPARTTAALAPTSQDGAHRVGRRLTRDVWQQPIPPALAA